MGFVGVFLEDRLGSGLVMRLSILVEIHWRLRGLLKRRIHRLGGLS